MPTLKMTDAAVQRATAPAGARIDYFDAHPRDRQRGLVLRVSGPSEGRPDGNRTWAVLFRVKGNSKLRRETLGDYPTIKLAEARETAAEIIKKAKRGIDPVVERRKAEIAAEIAGKDTIEALVERFMTDLAKRPKKKGGFRAARYIEETQRNFDNHVLPRWSDRNIREITRRDVNELLDAVADHGTDVRDKDGKKRHAAGGGIAANRTLSAISGFFAWAVRQGIIEATPASQLEKRGEEVERDRVLTDQEIKLLWPAARGLGYPMAHFFCISLVTGQRRNEVARMKWAQIDEHERTWTIPAGSNKGRRDHVVPLSALALELLAEAKAAGMALAIAKAERTKRVPTLGTYVFSTRGDAPVSGFSAAKDELDAAIAKIAANIESWRLHDLRRTCATGLAALGVDRFTISRVLNHADSGVTAIYDRFAYLDQKREALEKWGEHLRALALPPDTGKRAAKERENVVAFRAHA